MTKIDWAKDRTRKQAISSAANRLPNPIRATYDGQCPECHRPYHRGDRIARVTTGWAHHLCAIAPFSQTQTAQSLPARNDAGPRNR